MRSFLYKLSFKRRIWISFVLFISLSVSVTGTASYFIASSQMENNTLQLSQNSMNSSAQALDDKLRSIIVSVMTLMISEPFIQMLKDVAVNNNEHFYTYFSRLQTPFTQMQLNEPSISSILVSTPLGEFFPTNNYRSTDFSFQGSELHQKISRDGKPFWEKGHVDRLFRNGERVISLVMEPTTQIDVEGVYLVVNISEKALIGQMRHSLTIHDGAVLLLSPEEGQIVSADSRFASISEDDAFMNRASEQRGNFEYMVNHTDYLVNYAQLNTVPGWLLLHLQSKTELFKQLNWIKWTTVFLVAVSIVIASLLSNMLSGLLVKPLNQLKNLMRKAGSHQLDVRYSSSYQDEVAQVGDRFNSMMDELTELIHKIRDVEQEKRKAEMKALQAQIDPHFLYNTLNTIFWRCMSNDHDIAKEVIVSLSRLFELGLNKGLDMTTVEKELSHVQQYVNIQQRCYEGLFAFRIDIQDEALLQLPVLKIVLQPLVENSILHGFKNLESGGVIEIVVEKAEQMLHMTVRDNGMGMDIEDRYESLRDDYSLHTGFALRNVYHRIKLYYGDDAAIELYSEPYVRTEVKLIIPIAVPEE